MNIPVNFVVDMDISKFFETEVLPQLTGFARLIRYADDFVVCFEKDYRVRTMRMYENEAIRQEMRNL
ncbi:MAG: hypothetical protein J7K81_01325 [Methanophagales archaeon]|nr:hypothetical protein [Methanophagales archaeon]